jgi:hypothetical protein
MFSQLGERGEENLEKGVLTMSTASWAGPAHGGDPIPPPRWSPSESPLSYSTTIIHGNLLNPFTILGRKRDEVIYPLQSTVLGGPDSDLSAPGTGFRFQ